MVFAKQFNETDLLGVLSMIKDKHNASNDVRNVADDRRLSCDILQWMVKRWQVTEFPELRRILVGASNDLG